MTDTFRGFPAEGLDFLEGLAADNTRIYFEEHRPVYEEALLEPAKTFVDALGGQLHRRISKHLVADPRVNGSIMRINRDTRFSKDKTPYKTHLAFTFWEGGDRMRAPGFWMGLHPDRIGFGAGMHGLEKESLERYRAAVDDSRSGAALARAVTLITKGRRSGISEPKYRSLPKGYPTDHPRAELLRHAGFHVWSEHDVPKVYETPRFVGWCADRLERLAPVHTWFVKHLT